MQDLHSIHTHRLRRYHNLLNPKNPLNLLNPHAEGDADGEDEELDEEDLF